jgi:hypothetical protein
MIEPKTELKPKLWARCRVQLRGGDVVEGKITAITTIGDVTRLRVVHGEIITTVDAVQLIKMLDGSDA